jgi:hypothetical protein
MTSHVSEIYYPTEFRVQYANDKEYRAIIRTLCNMTSNIVALSQSDQDEDIDEITRDEWDFDQDAIAKLFNFIDSVTSKEPLFDEIYKKAAGFMLSEDSSIGLAVLFSYDYLTVFHPVLCDYFRSDQNGSGDRFDSNLPSVVHLRQKLYK